MFLFVFGHSATATTKVAPPASERFTETDLSYQRPVPKVQNAALPNGQNPDRDHPGGSSPNPGAQNIGGKLNVASRLYTLS